MRVTMARGAERPATEALAAQASEGRWPRICERVDGVRSRAAGAREAGRPHVF